MPYRRPTPLILINAALAAASCAPGTTRPAFFPYPDALVSTVNAPAARVAAEAAAWLGTEGLRVEWVSTQDGYVETSWFDTGTHQALSGINDVSDPQATIKLRCWADPDVPGHTRLTVEAVYRPIADPSRPERDLEVLVPPGHAGRLLAQRLLDALHAKLGGGT